VISRNKRFRVINYLDIAPLIDCMLLLLIFFLLTSSFINQDEGFSVNLPSALFPSTLEDSNLTVYVNSNKKIYLNNKEITILKLKTAFLSAKKPVIIKADKDVRLETVTSIMDLARSCKIEKLSIATINEK